MMVTWLSCICIYQASLLQNYFLPLSLVNILCGKCFENTISFLIKLPPISSNIHWWFLRWITLSCEMMLFWLHCSLHSWHSALGKHSTVLPIYLWVSVQIHGFSFSCPRRGQGELLLCVWPVRIIPPALPCFLAPQDVPGSSYSSPTLPF